MQLHLIYNKVYRSQALKCRVDKNNKTMTENKQYYTVYVKNVITMVNVTNKTLDERIEAIREKGLLDRTIIVPQKEEFTL